VDWNPGREAAKRFLHSIESLRFESIQVKRFRRQWNLFSSVVLNYNGEGSQRVLDMNANPYGTAADQQLLVFYVRAERSLTLLREPHHLVTLNVLPHGERQLLLWRGEEVKSVEFLSSWHDIASVQVHEGSWRKEIANNGQKQLMLQFILRHLGITRSNVEHIDTKTIYKTSELPVQLVLNKETKDPSTLNKWMFRVCLNSNNTTDANLWNVTGHYSVTNWYRCVSHCSAAMELLLCLFVYQLLSQQSKCVSRRNQILQSNLPRWQARKTRRGEKSTHSSRMERWIRNNQKNKSARPPLLKATFSGKTPQPDLISLDVCGQRKTNFSHEACFSSSVASTLSNSSSSSTSCRCARLKSIGSRPAFNEHDNDNMRQPP